MCIRVISEYKQVNQFLEEVQAKAVVSISDTHTTDDSGATIGLIRAVTYGAIEPLDGIKGHSLGTIDQMGNCC